MSPIDLSQAKQVGAVLSRHGVWLSREMGQHLLVDADVLRRIVEAAALGPKTEVLEVGPGVGALTAELSRLAGRVVAVELDHRMLAVLRETVPAPNVEVVNADALEVNLPHLFAGRPYSVVANLPYGVATPLLRRLLSGPPEDVPVELVVMVQREVARRLAARPGDMSRLAVEIQLVADVELLFEVGPQSFFPPPEVSSAVLRLVPLRGFRVPPLPNEERFFQTVEAGFRQRRKQLHNALGELGVGTPRIATALAATGIDTRRRAETLTVEEWSRLSAAIWQG
ncbi:MAG: 16S rRNA (adenine(1518)-N(6)/adenine(1519)-N(6))-dimethyltransferase RsmA [Chloroflexota bacterium]|nr:16S rRNA (adenine(1518)-N(6)/adenine(1519)-N(6))-dimethyltransferase RsmA [Chloroflexota bacterium]